MSKPKLAAVIATMGPDGSGVAATAYKMDCRTVWLFEVDENYSLDAVRGFFAENNRALGGDIHVRYEMARFKNIKRLLAWADRKCRNQAGLPPLTGWHGPLRLAASG